MRNSEQIEYWNGQAGETWVESQERTDKTLEPLSDRALSLAAVEAGEHALDVGCGCGTTTMRMAEMGGQATGMDISRPMLNLARERSKGLSNINFEEADASAANFSETYDLVFSRFGIMFFADPFAAFKNLATALKPQGRMLMMCWAAPKKNPWMFTAVNAARPLIPQPPAAQDPRAPGPFAFADPEYVTNILSEANLCNIKLDPFSTKLFVGQDAEQATNSQLRMGPFSRIFSELDETLQDKVLEIVKAAFKPHETDNGIWLDANVWMISANRQ